MLNFLALRSSLISGISIGFFINFYPVQTGKAGHITGFSCLNTFIETIFSVIL